MLLVCEPNAHNGQWTMPKVMYISTSYNKGISATTIVQCAAACKWLQPGSGQVDAFLMGLVESMRQPAYRGACPWRIVMSRTTAHNVRRASVYEGNPAKQINVAKSEAVQ